MGPKSSLLICKGNNLKEGGRNQKPEHRDTKAEEETREGGKDRHKSGPKIKEGFFRKEDRIKKNGTRMQKWTRCIQLKAVFPLRSLKALYIVAAEFDPLLDDAVEFAKRARAAGVSTVKLRVFPRLSHGFLSLVGGAELYQAQQYWIGALRQALFGGGDG